MVNRSRRLTEVPDKNTFESLYAGQAPWDIGKASCSDGRSSLLSSKHLVHASLRSLMDSAKCSSQQLRVACSFRRRWPPPAGPRLRFSPRQLLGRLLLAAFSAAVGRHRRSPPAASAADSPCAAPIWCRWPPPAVPTAASAGGAVPAAAPSGTAGRGLAPPPGQPPAAPVAACQAPRVPFERSPYRPASGLRAESKIGSLKTATQLPHNPNHVRNSLTGGTIAE